MGEIIGIQQDDVNLLHDRNKYWTKKLSQQTIHSLNEDSEYFIHQSLSMPVLDILSRASGIYIYDLDDKKYIDMYGNGVHNVGFNNQEVVQAVKQQLDSMLTCCPRRFSNNVVIELAKKLSEITPGNLHKSLFCPGGSEAIEIALQLSKLVTGKTKFISYWSSFHGATYAASSVSGQTHFNRSFGRMLIGTYFVDYPNYYRNPWHLRHHRKIDEHYIQQIEILLRRDPEIAAIIAEPISASPEVPSEFYWQEVAKLCKEHDVLLIFDEITEGLGRTGKMFACENFVTPDILVLGNSFGGGLLPFAGIVIKKEFDCIQDHPIGHYTHQKNALCAAAALATIKYIEENEIAEHALDIGDYAIERLVEMQDKYYIIGDVTGLGLHIGIDIVKDHKTKERNTEAAHAIMMKCFERGLSFKLIKGNIITLRPALIITEEQMAEALSILEEVIAEVNEIYIT